jgi:hypothetical protein
MEYAQIYTNDAEKLCEQLKDPKQKRSIREAYSDSMNVIRSDR